jgi:hypothetical protein
MSVQFDTRPVRRPRGPDRALLLALGLVAFVVLAVLKPWQSEDPRPLPSTPVPPRATPPLVAAAIATPAPSPASRSDRELVNAIGQSWSALRGSLSERSSLGFRAITGPDQSPSPGGGADRDATITTLLAGTFVEHWNAVPADEAAVLAARASGDVPSTLLARASRRQPVFAVGVTTSPAATPLDIRFWRLDASGPLRLGTSDLGGAAPDRVYLPPAEDRPSAAWAAGRYLAELLLQDRILALPFEIVAGPTAVGPVRPPVGFTASAMTIEAVLPVGARGAFAVHDGARPTVVPASAADPLDAHAAWLAVHRSPTRWPPVVVQFKPDPVILGVTLPAQSVLQSASIWRVAPVAAPLPAIRHAGSGFVAFSPLEGTWPAATYRITVRYWDAAYQLRETSWHLDVGGPGPILRP